MAIVRIALAGALLSVIGCELQDEGEFGIDRNVHEEYSTAKAIAPMGSPMDVAGDRVSTQIPSGAIMFFDTHVCPDGWRAVNAARGRALVGLPEGGTLGGGVGEPLADEENRTHGHSVVTGNHTHKVAIEGNTTAAGAHNHQWAWYTARDWYSYTSAGNPTLVGSWDDGIGSGGSGDYPLYTGLDNGELSFYTTRDGNHTHGISAEGTELASGGLDDETGDGNTMSSMASIGEVIPYIQFLVCRKD